MDYPWNIFCPWWHSGLMMQTASNNLMFSKMKSPRGDLPSSRFWWKRSQDNANLKTNTWRTMNTKIYRVDSLEGTLWPWLFLSSANIWKHDLAHVQILALSQSVVAYLVGIWSFRRSTPQLCDGVSCHEVKFIDESGGDTLLDRISTLQVNSEYY